MPAFSPQAPAAPQTGDAATSRYLIGPQDLLKITVLDEPELTNDYRVDSDGFITFPYVGRVLAGGLNPGDLQDRIKNMLSPAYIKNPQVRVEIDQYKSQSVMVSGEVRQPGKIPMTGAMSILEALAAAGSPTPAASSELTIARPRKPGSDQPDSEIVRINWKDLQLGKGTDVVLQDGDLLNIAKRRRSSSPDRSGTPAATCSAVFRPPRAPRAVAARRPVRPLRPAHAQPVDVREGQARHRFPESVGPGAAGRHDHHPAAHLLMCGIAGVIQRDGPLQGDVPALASALGAALAHRGPDGAGTWVAPDSEGANVLFVHRRLAIIDPGPGGSQPMSTPEGRYRIVFNGEVYNYRALRADLESRGTAS
jgi:protein involved in polysaccharide export with SLBB domain